MNTNIWDAFCIFFFFSYLLAIIGGTAYLVDQRGWSPSWFVVTLILAGIKMKTGGYK